MSRSVAVRPRASIGPRVARRTRWRPELSALEDRLLLSSEGCIDLHHDGTLYALPPVEVGTFLGPVATVATGASQALTGAVKALGGIPALNSLPGAAASLYLNFLGDTVASWGAYSNIKIPAFDQDGNPTSFSDSELTTITDIWKQVAEDYAPFNINITTVAPASFADGVALRVDIGGDGSWTGRLYGGISYVDSFSNSVPNVAFVFPTNLCNGVAKYTGDAASHEAGHAFGLQHQSQYTADGRKIAEYSTGPGDGTAPLMGNSYGAPLSRWWNGPTTSASTLQDDMTVIARTANKFGYRPDDVGNTATTASPLTVSGAGVGASGIIGATSDVDVFSFRTGAGPVHLTITVPAGINNLVPRLELRDATGSTLIASVGADASDDATIDTTLPAGSYRLVVASDGAYGSVGQYTVRGTIVATASLVAPSNLTATATKTGPVSLSWTDNTATESGYVVERSADGLTWVTLTANLPAGSTSYTDASVLPGTRYSYRVHAFNAAITSDSSNMATATTISAAPAGLTATLAAGRITLSWRDVTGETSFRVKRSLDGITWSVIGTTAAGVTTFTDSLGTGVTAYRYCVQAVNDGGASPDSNIAVMTPPAPTAPAAPSGLVASVGSASWVTLTWKDNASNESGFRIERSTDGGKTWVVLAQLGANVTAYTDNTTVAGASYSYRVRASNAVGASAYSNVATASTPKASTPKPVTYTYWYTYPTFRFGTIRWV